jgi:hypothetical protein
MRETTLAVNRPEITPQLIRMARLAIAIVTAERYTSVIISSDGASVEEVASSALVGEVALGYVHACGVLVVVCFGGREGGLTRQRECRSHCRRRRRACRSSRHHER